MTSVPVEQRPGLYRFARAILWLFLRIWERFRVEGAENVPAEGGCLIASNHTSFLDPPALGCAVRHRMVHFLARDTLFRWRVSRWFFRSVGCIPMDRTRGDVAALRKSLEVLRSGRVLAMFPEGTRSLDGQIKPAKGGVGFIIARAGVPVVPAYIEGTYEALRKHAKWIRPGRITVRFGTPITTTEISQLGQTRESYEEIGRLVMSRIAALRCPK